MSKTCVRSPHTSLMLSRVSAIFRPEVATFRAIFMVAFLTVRFVLFLYRVRKKIEKVPGARR